MARKKIERLQDDYELLLDAELAERRRSGSTLKELQEFVNREVATAATSGTPIAGDQVYRVLSEDVSRQEHADIANRLEEYGIAIDEIERDFISHETVRAYLHSELHVHPEKEETLSRDDVLERSRASEERYENLIEYHLRQLDKRDNEFSLGDGITIMIDVDIICDRSGETQSLKDFITTGGCSD